MNKLVLFIFLFLGLMAPAFFTSAATGTIDSTYKYAWGENTGWINFRCDNCNVQITDTAMTGYIWSKSYGWINLNPTNGGVSNTTAGILSGYAWGKNTGWVDFSGLAIGPSGLFVGTATGDITGDIIFECLTNASCMVKTDWTPSVSSCGDGICNSVDTCVTCSADCGNCPIPGTEYKNVCISQKCVSIQGSGDDDCQTDSECAGSDLHGDINKDGSINLADTSIIMYFWNQINPSNPYADINNDGKVDILDFSIMLYWWTR